MSPVKFVQGNVFVRWKVKYIQQYHSPPKLKDRFGSDVWWGGALTQFCAGGSSPLIDVASVFIRAGHSMCWQS